MERYFLSALFFLALLSASPSCAQIQQGYAEDSTSPDVQIDRSVLEDLKDYQPPPMFGSTPDVTPAVTPALTPALTPAPAAPILTTPKAEDILNHPIENNHVLTQQQPQLTQPIAPPYTAPVAQPLLPMPDDEPSAKPSAKPSSKKNVEKETVKNTDKKGSKKPDKKTDTKLVNSKPADKKPAYRPQTPKTMPAVPSIKVEKDVLPPVTSPALPELPPTTDNMMEHSKPSIGERMIDAALDRHIEKDDTKIKETLEAKPIKTVVQKSASSPKNTPVNHDSTHHSLTYKNGQTDLDKTNEAQLTGKIIPYFINNSTGRIQILSFASSTDGTESSARRISLSRALTVRDFMLNQKISPERIDVRALTNQSGATPASDRIDIVLLK